MDGKSFSSRRTPNTPLRVRYNNIYTCRPTRKRPARDTFASRRAWTAPVINVIIERVFSPLAAAEENDQTRLVPIPNTFFGKYSTEYFE